MAYIYAMLHQFFNDISNFFLSTNTSDFLKQIIILKPFYSLLTLKAPIATAADDIHKYLFNCFSEKIRFDVSSESSARQRIHMKHQALFSSKDKSKKLKCRLLHFCLVL